MKKLICFCASMLLFIIAMFAQPKPTHNLHFDQLATKWDEAMPLGNGMLGILIWEKNQKLRLSLDRADLWDERKALDLSKFDFNYVVQQVYKKDYLPVQVLGDHPYDKIPYPTKLPAAAIEFSLKPFGKVTSNILDIEQALITIKFENGVLFKSYIHAVNPVGYFTLENLPLLQSDFSVESILPQLIIHNYNSPKEKDKNENSHSGQGLEKLGYDKGVITRTKNSVRYHQPTYGSNYFEVLVQWEILSGNKMVGSWTIANNQKAILRESGQSGFEGEPWKSHIHWWKNFWNKSSVHLPDTLIEKQYYLELYKLGSVARKGAPAITLQAVWTADNGSLPPWKGDFHNDLNTQLSYWPSYTGNHLEEAATFTDWLWKIREKNLNYTKQYFKIDGLNVPGVVTLNGDPMGGWIQYSLSPTVGAWAAQHFYWQWKYSMDRHFLETKAYPYISEAAKFLDNITRQKDGKRKLPLSSSPEYNDNSINAWFLNWTNFDLSLAKFLFQAAASVSNEMGKKEEAKHWLTVLGELPDYDVHKTGLTVAPGQAFDESHRHLSPYMAIYPLALLNVNKALDKKIIQNSLKQIEKLGTRAWTGYSFSWMASLYARAYEADKAVKQLQIFASNFCSPNSFHLNGDQKGGQHSNFTYRPFTLEGNFAFAQGVHELLLQSRDHYLEVFPAVPGSWKNVSFTDLRGEGAFLISATKENGIPLWVKAIAEKGGILKIKLPFNNFNLTGVSESSVNREADGITSIRLQKGQTIIFKNKSL